MGKQTEVEKTLAEIVSKIRVEKTTYNHSESTYTIDNFTIDLQYNDAKQVIDIPASDLVSVTNGTVYIGYRFNYSVTNSKRSVNGWAHGNCLFYCRIRLLGRFDLPEVVGHELLRVLRMELARQKPLQKAGNKQQNGHKKDGSLRPG